MAAFLSTDVTVDVHGANPHDWPTSVSLTDNLMEPFGNGFCIDIIGRQPTLNCSVPLHVHSCKPTWPDDGLDQQFMYDAAMMRLQAAGYTADCMLINSTDHNHDDGHSSNGCVQVIGEAKVGSNVILANCSDGMMSNPSQMFMYNNETQSFFTKTVNDTDLCLTAGRQMNDAGPMFKRRALTLEECATDDGSGDNTTLYQQWTIVGKKDGGMMVGDHDMHNDTKTDSDDHEGHEHSSTDMDGSSMDGSSSETESEADSGLSSRSIKTVIGTLCAMTLSIVLYICF